MCFGLQHHHGHDFDVHSNQMCPDLRALFQAGRDTTPQQIAAARTAATRYRAYFEGCFEGADIMLTLAVPGEAPTSGLGTGSPLFCMLWSPCGLPAVSVPFGTGKAALPLAVQFVGWCEGDEALLGWATWAVERFQMGSN